MVNRPFFLTLIFTFSVSIFADADEKNTKPNQSEDKSSTPASNDAKPAQKEGYQLQRLDDPALPFQGIKGRSEDKQRIMDAASWFMTGRFMATRQRYKEAMSAFQEAVKLDPSYVGTYRNMMEVAAHLGDFKLVMEYARKVIELDPDDFALLRQLGVQLARENKIEEAIQYLETARKSSRLEKESGFYVLLSSDLGTIYSVIQENERAADCFEVVFDALRDPTKYSMDRRTLTELQRNRTTSYERLGQVFLAADRLGKAREALELAAAEKNRRPGTLNLSLAEVYQKTDQPKKALEQLELFYGSKLKRGKKPYQLLQQVLRDLNRESELLDRVEKLADESPRNRDLQYFLAEVYVGFKRLDDAEKIYRDTLANGPDAGAYLGLASIFRHRGKAQELLDNLSKTLEQQATLLKVAETFEAETTAIQKNKELLAQLVEIVRTEAQGNPVPAQFNKLMLVAQLSAQAKNHDTAAQLFRLALRADQARAERVFTSLGSMLIDAEKYAEAAKVYKEAINHPRAQGNKINLLLSLAFCQEMSGNTEGALEAINQGRQLLAQDHPIFDYREAWIYYHSGQHKIAIEKYEAFLKKHPNSELTKTAKFSLSALYVRIGNAKRGEEILEEYLAENPEDPGVNNDLGYLYADQGKNLERARKMIEKAIKAEPENGAYLDSMGWVLFKLGEHKEALTWLVKASEKENGQDPTIWEHLGDCHHRLKDLDKARDAWQKALDLSNKETSPDEELVNRVKDKLKIEKPE